MAAVSAPSAAAPVVRRVVAPVTGGQRLAAAVGLLLIAIGALGFVADDSFGTGDDLGRGSFLGFDVNGWANVGNLAVGALLLLAASRRAATRTAWRLLALGALIAFVAGLVDGDDVFGLFPENTWTHVFDGVMLAVAVAGSRTARERRSALERDRLVLPEPDGPLVVGPGSGHVGGPRRYAARIDARL